METLWERVRRGFEGLSLCVCFSPFGERITIDVLRAKRASN